MRGKNIVNHWCFTAKLVPTPGHLLQRISNNSGVGKTGKRRLRSVWLFLLFTEEHDTSKSGLMRTEGLSWSPPPQLGNYCSSILTTVLSDHPTAPCRYVADYHNPQNNTGVFSVHGFTNPGIIPLLNCKSFNVNNCNNEATPIEVFCDL